MFLLYFLSNQQCKASYKLRYGTQWNSAFFAFSLIVQGSTEKVLQFIMPFKSIYNKNI